MTYYTYNSETKSLTPAPSTITTETAYIIKPSASQYATLLNPPAYPLAEDDVPPTPPEGKAAVHDGYELRNNKWYKVYIFEDAAPETPTVHTYKRSYLAQWLRQNNHWYDFKDLLAQSEELEFMWETSTEFDSDHPMWQQAITGVKLALELSDEDIVSMLHYGETGQSLLE